jgi:hypothetical protein
VVGWLQLFTFVASFVVPHDPAFMLPQETVFMPMPRRKPHRTPAYRAVLAQVVAEFRERGHEAIPPRPPDGYRPHGMPVGIFIFDLRKMGVAKAEATALGFEIARRLAEIER